MRIVYKNNDLLYVSIHSLHRSQNTSQEGTDPASTSLAQVSGRPQKKTKKKVKDIAAELIKLYAKRNPARLCFCSDNYLQHELEASFIYEDTPDQYKAHRMSTGHGSQLSHGPTGMRGCRLLKDRVALRAAFKAVLTVSRLPVGADDHPGPAALQNLQRQAQGFSVPRRLPEPLS
jgi:transcription-repair coupling factor (superfamily II helicase)